MNPGEFDISTLFGLGTSIATAMRSGINALVLHFGDTQDNYVRMAAAMRAFRREVGVNGDRLDHLQCATIDSAVGLSLLAGVDFVITRFGDTAATRVEIIRVFQVLEAEWQAKGDLPSTEDYDRDDLEHDRFARRGTSWGSLTLGSSPFGNTS